MSETNGNTAMTPGQAVSTYKAIGRIGDQAWDKWKELGYFVIERVAIAQAKAGATRGTTYAAALQKGLGQFTPIYQKLSGNGTLTGLMKCMAKLDEIEAFRNRLKNSEKATEPPSHPQRMWAAFEASQMSSIAFEDDGDGDEDGEADGKKARKAHGKEGHNREKELLAEIAALREEIARLREQYQLTGDHGNDAQRLWRRLVDQRGHTDSTAELAVQLGEALATIGHDNLAKEIAWKQAEPHGE